MRAPSNPTRRPRGTTMIEILMVIFIISVVLCLMIPAIQSGREAAMRAQCTNNLRQLILALHNYETCLGALPPGVVDETGPIANRPEGLHIGWIVQLLPYMEQMGVSMTIDTRESVYAPVNQKAASITMKTLICPNDEPQPMPLVAMVPTIPPPPGAVPPPAVPSRTSYAACHHDVEAPIDVDNHGMFFLNSALRQADIEDGSSYTIFVGEKRSDANDLGWMSGTRATLRNTGWPLSAGWRTPNAPPPPAPTSDEAVGGFGSWHEGGVNFAFGDGSVRFLSVTTSPKLLRLLGHRADGETIDDF